MTNHELVYVLSLLFVGILAGITIDAYLITPTLERRAKKEREFQKKVDEYAKAHGLLTSRQLEAQANGLSIPKE